MLVRVSRKLVEPVSGTSERMELNPYFTLLFRGMDALSGDPEAVGYPLESPTFLPQPGDHCMLWVISLRVRMGMFEEELTPAELAIPNLTRWGTSVSLMQHS